MSQAELKDILFYRRNVLKCPHEDHLLTLNDADEHKLPAVDKLLRTIFDFNLELNSVGIPLVTDKYAQYPKQNMYVLTDTEFENWDAFKIIVKSDWLNPKERKRALHANFEFYLYLIQDAFKGRSEIADWIRIHIQHLKTTPISFASEREHVKAMSLFLKNPNGSYFYDIPMNYTTTVSFSSMDEGLNFKTSNFIETVEDSCRVLSKIIYRKQFLKIHDGE